MDAPRPGTLVLVVGPSGAGKDSLIAYVQARLPAGRFAFPQRAVTRPADAGSEAHEAVTADAFADRVRAGGFALSWEAHGLAYGIPAGIASELAAGRHVVANVSRSVLGEARRRFARVLVVSVEAPAEVLAARLAARGRTSDGPLAGRLARAGSHRVAGDDVVVIDNAGRLEDAGEQLLSRLRAL